MNGCLKKPSLWVFPADLLSAHIAGYGRHGHMHEETFFELAGELAVKVEFIIDDALAEKLLERVHRQSMNIFYVKQPVQVGAG